MYCMHDLETHIQSLPYDLREYIYQHVEELRKPKCVLPMDLRLDIETYTLLDRINNNYYSIHDTFWEDWVENAMINMLNDHQGFIGPLQPCFARIFPGKTDEEIKLRLLNQNNTRILWRGMPPRQRISLYILSCELAWF